MHFIRPGLRNHIDDSASSTAEFRARSCRHYLELFHGVERNVDRRALSTKLLAEETIVVVTTIETYVVKDATLSGKCDLVSVRTLDYAYARCQRQQVFKLSSQNRSGTYRRFIQSRAGFCFDGIDSGSRGNSYVLLNSGHPPR